MCQNPVSKKMGRGMSLPRRLAKSPKQSEARWSSVCTYGAVGRAGSGLGCRARGWAVPYRDN